MNDKFLDQNTLKSLNFKSVGSNVSISKNATIGALSFVKENLKSWSVYAGNPIKFINTRKKK